MLIDVSLADFNRVNKEALGSYKLSNEITSATGVKAYVKSVAHTSIYDHLLFHYKDEEGPRWITSSRLDVKQNDHLHSIHTYPNPASDQLLWGSEFEGKRSKHHEITVTEENQCKWYLLKEICM